MLSPLEADLRALPRVEEVSCNYLGNCQVFPTGFKMLEKEPSGADTASSKLYP